MPKAREENFPLLHFDESTPNRDNQRVKNITEGATYYVKKLPDTLGVGWLTTLLLCIFLFFLLSIVFIQTEPSSYQHRRCERSISPIYNNETVHLVHHFGHWNTNETVNYHKIAANASRVHLVLLEKAQNETTPYLHNITANTIVENLTYADVFEKSPLIFVYPKFSHDLMILAVRVLQLWQYGGISLDLETSPDSFKNKNKIYKKDAVIIDEKGRHFQSPKPCHAFFEDMLRVLRKSKGNESDGQIVADTLNQFCGAGKIKRRFCRKIFVEN